VSVLYLIAVCLVTGVAIRLLRRLPRLVFVASLIGASALGFILATAPTESILFFGRALTLDLAARAFIAPAIAIAAALSFFSLLTFERASRSPTDIIAHSQGAFFFWSLAPLIAAIALGSFPIAVFFWAVGLIVLVLAANSQREGRVGGAAHFLLLTVIASACLLLANRLIDLYPLTPENVDLIRNTVIFFALGFGLILSVVPLGSWLGPLTDEMPLLGTAFLVGVAQPVGLWLLFQQMNDVTWLVAKSPLLDILLAGGVITVPTSALLALGEKRPGRFVAYLSMLSLGHALIGLGLGTQLGLIAAMLAMFNRAAGVALVAGGMSFVQHHTERRWQVVGALAILCGGLALSGIAPVLGFAANYSMYLGLASNVTLVVVLLASNGLALLATIRLAWSVLIEKSETKRAVSEFKLVPYLCAGVAVVLVIAVVLAGLFPQMLAAPIVDVLGKAAYFK
jgi:formate hydrogenlyase subunit 3/multisubunit Na+/H+ antiporter MnhD subunit